MNENLTGDTLVIGALNGRAARDEMPKQVSKEVVEEISIDMDEIKSEIEKTVRSAIANGQIESGASGEAVSQLNRSLNNIKSELEAIKVRLQAIQHSTEDRVRDNGNNITALHKSFADIRDRIGEIAQTMNGISKVSDSVFDLKNAQVNMKKSIDSNELSIRALKKKLSVAAVIFSVIGVLIIVLQIITLLS